MTFNAARPRYTLPFAGKDYELLGTFGLIEAVEYAMKEHVYQVAVQVVNSMSCTDLSRLVAAVLTACDHKMTSKEAFALLWDHVGMVSEENTSLRLHIYSFLSICLAPPSHREQKAKMMGEMMGKPTSPAASPGPSTAESA